MMLAVTIGASDILPALRDAGDSIDGMLPVAARNGLKEAVGTLLDLGASIDEPWDRDGTTALERAILGNDLDLATFLIARGANVNHIGDRFKFTPLHHAASVDYGDSAMVDLLLKSGAQPDSVTRDGQTALDLARKFRHTHLIASLQRVSLGGPSR
jgi:ankyrin repeat protein